MAAEQKDACGVEELAWCRRNTARQDVAHVVSLRIAPVFDVLETHRVVRGLLRPAHGAIEITELST